MATKSRKVSESDLQFAEEVLEVFRLGGDPLPRTVTPSLKRLYDWSLNPENYDALVKTLAPKAGETLARHRQPQEQDFIVAEERRSISELQSFLQQYVRESQENEHSSGNAVEQRPKQTWVDRERPAHYHEGLAPRLDGDDRHSRPGGEGADNQRGD